MLRYLISIVFVVKHLKVVVKCYLNLNIYSSYSNVDYENEIFKTYEQRELIVGYIRIG